MSFCTKFMRAPQRMQRGALLTCTVFLLNTTFIPPALAADPSATLRYRMAIEDARNNKLDAAKETLQTLLAAEPSNRAYRLDLIAVNSWKGDAAEAVRLAKELDPIDAQIPVYVLKAWAAAERNVRNLDRAEEIYRLVLKRDSSQKGVWISLASIDLDRNQPDQAIEKLQKLNPNTLSLADQQSRLEVLTIAFIAKQDYVRALDTSEALLKIAPNNRVALNARFASSMQLGAPRLALTRTLEIPSKDVIAARRDAIARDIRWGETEIANSDANSPSRWQTTDLAIDRALSHIDQLKSAENQDADAVLRQKYDLMVAYVNRRRLDDAISLYESVAKESPTTPAWVKLKIAPAYLTKRQPKVAVDLYQQGLATNGWGFGDRVGYVYALLESERNDEAITEADKLVVETPEWLNNQSPTTRKENEDYTQALLLAARVRAYSGQLQEAESRLKDLSHRAPGNDDIAAVRAMVEQLRGKPRIAGTRLNRLNTQSPTYASVAPLAFDATLDMQAYRVAEENLSESQRVLPEEFDTRRIEKNWQNYQKRESRSRLSVGKTEGGSEGFAGDNTTGDFTSLNFDTRLYSAPIAYNWRVFSHAAWDQSSNDSVNFLRRQLGIGADYRSLNWDAEAEVFGVNGSSSIGGFRASGSYHPDDFNTYSLAYSKNDNETTPIRGFADGVRSDFVRGTYAYRWNESRLAGLSLGLGHFSDGNDRSTADAWYQQRTLTKPHYTIDLRADVGLLHNNPSSNTAVNYYNPDRQTNVSASMINRWLQWREYERQVTHELTLTAGQSWQKSFGSDPWGKIDYQFLYQINPAIEWGAGLTVARIPYDGVLETDYSARTILNWKF